MATIRQGLINRVSTTPSRKEQSPSRAYRGFSTVSPDVEGYRLYDFDLIKQDIINHFHIRQGEKLSDPTFGTIIWDMLWEPFTPEVQQLIVDNVTSIINNDPRVSASDITVDTYEHGIQIECTLTFLKYNISDTLRFRFDQNNGFV